MSWTVSDLLNFLKDKNPSAKILVSVPANDREIYIIEKELQGMPLDGRCYSSLTEVVLVPEPNQIWSGPTLPPPPKPSRKPKSGVTTKGG